MVARAMAMFDLVRRLMVFLLGVAIILEALKGEDDSISELLIGMVMVGVLPIENLLQPWWRVPGRPRPHREPPDLADVPAAEPRTVTSPSDAPTPQLPDGPAAGPR